MDRIKEKSKTHTIYKLPDGTRVVGCTTVVSLLAKPFLVPWANRLGLEGIDSTKYKDAAADIGTLAHLMIQCHLQKEELDTSDYSQSTIDQAENSFLSYLEWEKHHTIETILCEKQLVHEQLKYGGTIDHYCKLDGAETLLDFKTGKNLYNDYFVQVAGYNDLLRANGYEVTQQRILRIGRDETEGFEDRLIGGIDKYFEIFVSLLGIYNLKKEVKWE